MGKWISQIHNLQEMIMSYILSLQFIEGGEKYYIDTCADASEFNEVYDPRFATEFKTQKKALSWAKANTDWVKYIKVVNKSQAVDEYTKWVEQGTIRRIIPKINKKYSRPYTNESKEEILEWWLWFIAHDGEVAYEDYQTWPSLYSVFKHLWGVNYYSDGTQTISIYTSKDGDFQTFKDELDLVFDKITYKTDLGFIIFPVFDHYLSEGGNTANLLYDPKTEKVEIQLRYNSLLKFPNLEEAFEYLKRERYYEL
jgi:hypothetical protein